ncbi:phosphoglycolate phosphatase [Methylobacterium sp. NEAU K]|uniref:phosphoglycolate phosphatase n=1 Tax=Methylobacterium sp. NEAU K TaxID=3064946 RepID=UPI0027347BD9|nr:phosphoglycolate phosphatase [Methylobacterium sp. NEAU K]MDP4003638.1 phosphoglycolate phosphatase [Methylobacterium sp. NEAU K]
MPPEPTTRPPIAVFDLDGTLAETAGDLIGTLNVLMRREGLAELPLSQARGLIGAGAKALIRRGFEAEGRPLSQTDHDRLFDAFIDHYGAHLADTSHLYPGLVEALDALEETGFRLAVCTNKFEGQSVELLRMLGIGHRFAAICGRDTFPHYKPDPRHLTGTIARAGGNPARAVMVGDSRTDIDTAKAAGIPVVAVAFGYTDVPVTELGPDRVIGHFSELAGAIGALVQIDAT